MSEPFPYEQRAKNFDWSVAERELGWRPGDPINIGWYCSDRICRLGQGAKTALIWEGSEGRSRTYSFDDLRVLSNTIGQYLRRLGIGPGDRVCLFMDRIPELYIGFLGVLKIGAIVQPLFSAFGDESLFTRLKDAETAAIVTQRKHLAKVRKIRDTLPSLRHIIVADGAGASLQEREVVLTLDEEPRVEEFELHDTRAETPSIPACPASLFSSTGMAIALPTILASLGASIAPTRS